MTNILLSRGILAQFKPDLEHLIRPNMKVVIIAYSFYPWSYSNQLEYESDYQTDGNYYDKMIESFSAYGIPPSQISWILYQKDTVDLAIEKINAAHIIYFPGGAPDLMMQRLIDMNLQSHLENPDKIYIGSSAGAMIQFPTYHITPDYVYPKFIYAKGLHLIEPILIEVHYAKKRIQKRSFRKVFRRLKKPIYAIPDDGCIVIHQQKISCLGTARKIYPKG